MNLRHWLQVAADLVFPRHCLSCRCLLAPDDRLDLCAECLARLRPIAEPYCPHCGLMYVKSGGHSHLCPLCITGRYAFDRARAVFCYNNAIGRLIHALKFSGKRTGLRTLAALAADSALAELSPPDLIVPVPLHKRKLQSRGFNQSQLLARAIFAGHREKICHCLVRSRETRPQTGLRGNQRRKNVVGAFRVIDQDMVVGKNICLVDDVLTTGTTVNECAKVLRRAGARRIEVCTVARVV